MSENMNICDVTHNEIVTMTLLDNGRCDVLIIKQLFTLCRPTLVIQNK